MGGDSSGSLPESLSKSIGPGGGELRIRGVTLKIPPGALTRQTELTVANLGEKVASALPSPGAGFRFVAGPTSFQPHGQVFQLPVDIEMTTGATVGPFALKKLDDPNDTTWSDVPDASIRVPSLQFATKGFSVYALFEGSDTDSSSGGAPSGAGGGGSASGGASAGVGGTLAAVGGDANGGLGGDDNGSPGTGGGTVAAGGSGGMTSLPTPAGYYRGTEWGGYWFEVPSETGATLVTDVAQATMPPYCVQEFVVEANETAGIGFSLAESEDRQMLGVWDSSAFDGISIDLHNTSMVDHVFRVVLIDAQEVEWCAPIVLPSHSSSNVLEFRFTDFYRCDRATTPGTLQGGLVALKVLAETVQGATRGSFCINSVGPVVSLNF